MKMFQNGIDSPNHETDGFHVDEVLAALSKLALNDKNKVKRICIILEI